MPWLIQGIFFKTKTKREAKMEIDHVKVKTVVSDWLEIKGDRPDINNFLAENGINIPKHGTGDNLAMTTVVSEALSSKS